MIENLDRLSGLYLKRVPDKGFGLFCRDIILGDAVIERTPVLVFNETDAKAIDTTHLVNYYFSPKALTQEGADLLGVAKDSRVGLMALGVVSMCNHSDKPNALVENMVVDGALYFVLRAKKGILAHEEICISYGSKLWFEQAPEKNGSKRW